MMQIKNKILRGAFFCGFLLLVLSQVYCGKSQPVAQESCGYKQNSEGQRISLKSNLPLKLYFDSQFPQEYRSAVVRAVQTWNKAAGKVLFRVDGEVARTQPVHDSVNVIYWRSTWDQSSNSSQKEQANTVFYWVDNEIIEADIIINGQNFSYSAAEVTPPGQVDMESLAIHELGHALGFVHIENKSSVMAPELLNGQMRRSPTEVDMVDLRCEY